MVEIIYEAFPCFCLGVITLGAYIMAIKKMKELPKELLSTMDIKIYKLLWYPAVLWITFMPTAAENIFRLFFEASSPAALIVLRILVPHSIGFTNAIVYGLQSRLNRKIYSNKSSLLYSSVTTSARSNSVLDELEKADRLIL